MSDDLDFRSDLEKLFEKPTSDLLSYNRALSMLALSNVCFAANMLQEKVYHVCCCPSSFCFIWDAGRGRMEAAGTALQMADEQE